MAATIGKLAIQLSLQSQQFSSGIGKVGSQLSTFKANVTKMAGVVAGAFAGRQIIGSLREQAQAMENLGDFAKDLGLSTEFVATLEHAAKMAGASFDDVAMGLLKLSKLQGEALLGDPTAIKTFEERYRLSVDQLRELKDEGLFLAVAKGIREIEHPAIRTATAMETFGKGAGKMLEILRDSGSFPRLRQEIESFGMPVSKEDFERVEEMNKAVRRMDSQWTSAKRNLVVGIAEIDESIGFSKNILEFTKIFSQDIRDFSQGRTVGAPRANIGGPAIFQKEIDLFNKAKNFGIVKGTYTPGKLFGGMSLEDWNAFQDWQRKGQKGPSGMSGGPGLGAAAFGITSALMEAGKRIGQIIADSFVTELDISQVLSLRRDEQPETMFSGAALAGTQEAASAIARAAAQTPDMGGDGIAAILERDAKIQKESQLILRDIAVAVNVNRFARIGFYRVSRSNAMSTTMKIKTSQKMTTMTPI